MSGAVGSGAVTAGGGQIAGIGMNNPSIPNQAEPGVQPKKRNPILFKNLFARKAPVQESLQENETFAGNIVFTVDSHTFHLCRMGKRKWARWAKYVSDNEVGRKIRDYGYKYPYKPIILKNGNTGAMLWLRYGNNI